MKKFYSLLVCSFMSLCLMTTTVSAASGLNEAEKGLLEYLSTYSTTNNATKFTLTEDLLTKVENYLISDGVDLTEEQVNEVIRYIDEGINALVETEALSGKDLTAEEGQSFVNEYIVPICDVLKLSVTYDAKNSIVTIKDVDGNIVYTDDEPIKDTGSNASITYTMLGCLSLFVIGLGLSEYKKKVIQ